MHRRFAPKEWVIVFLVFINFALFCKNNIKCNARLSVDGVHCHHTIHKAKFIAYFSLFTFVGGKKPVEHHAAVWVPDNEANVCMHCKKTQFTMIIRRVCIFVMSIVICSYHFKFRLSCDKSISHVIFLFILASLPKLRCSRMWTMFIEEIFVTTTKFKTGARMPRLLWFVESIKEWTGEQKKNRLPDCPSINSFFFEP